ncbi:hypothetical protein [Streptosporangium minutum]|uniref:hypothetical protein n=1 Tax=Streptosporangium minutum TaxID=569862 RepID=UPI0013FD7F7F|nr:hypothetical protein [Streptosporangium minutum]
MTRIRFHALIAAITVTGAAGVYRPPAPNRLVQPRPGVLDHVLGLVEAAEQAVGHARRRGRMASNPVARSSSPFTQGGRDIS